MNKRITFLTADNSFLKGTSRVLDVGSTRNKNIYDFSNSEEEADKKALVNDWSLIGSDMWGAYDKFKQKA
ncbi:hypothetical protein [Streptococcus pluranimalium]|uniref:hypothetical protein n=1 Tax=Streptococcus pluranimalium TaxID=82348 RepID=UPI003F67D4AB